MKILAFGDIHFHHTHRFSYITPQGFTVRELEHLQCADVIIDLYKKENIDKVVFLGDCWGPVGDMMSCQTLMAVTEFIKKISEVCEFDIIVGNHDLSSHLNNHYSHKLMPFKYWSNVNVYDQPTLIDNFVYMPYCIHDEYAESFLNSIEDKSNKIIFSHLELSGINLGNGIFTQKGVDLEVLRNFKMTLQGHYHSGGNYGKNIQIAGSTQRLSYKDQGISRRNILIYDTDTNKVERRSFNCPDWLIFNDDNIEDILNLSSDNYVKVEVSTDILLTEEIKNKLNTFKGKDVSIDVTRISVNRQAQEEIIVEDEAGILAQFIDKSDNSEDQKEALRQEGIKLVERVK